MQILLIKLEYRLLDEETIAALAKLVSAASSATGLSLAHCEIESIPQFLEFLLSLKNLNRKWKLLNFSTIGLNDDMLSTISLLCYHEDESPMSSLKFSSSTGSLLRLILLGNDAASFGIERLSIALSNPFCCITTLNVAECDIDDTDALSLKKGLESNRSILKLILSRNRLTSKGISFIVTALISQKNIRILVLDGNDLSYPGHNIRNLLFVAQNLKELRCSDCQIGHESLIEIAYGIVSSKSLVKLDLSHNFIEQKTALCIFDAIAENPILSELTLWGNECETSEIMDSAIGILKTYNSKLTVTLHRSGGFISNEDDTYCAWNPIAKRSSVLLDIDSPLVAFEGVVLPHKTKFEG